VTNSRIQIQPFTEMSSVLYDLIRCLMVLSLFIFHILQASDSFEAETGSFNRCGSETPQSLATIDGHVPDLIKRLPQINVIAERTRQTRPSCLGYSAVHLCTSYSVRHVLDCSACMHSFLASSLSYWSLLRYLALCSQDTGLEAFNDSEMVAPTEYHPPWESIYARQYISCEFSDRLIPPDIIITFQQLRL